MDGSQGSSGAPAPFLLKTYELVDDSSTDTIVSWSQNGCSFVVWNQTEFAKELLPMYFKHNNFSSFVRQLNTYGFRKIDPDQWEFANEEFLRGGRHLLKNIHRRKPIHSHSGPAQGHPAAPLTDSEKQEYENEIARLRHENNALQSELQRHENERKELDLKARSLHDRFQHIELRQARLMSSFAEQVRNPGLVSALVQRSELHSKKRRVSGSESNSEETRDFLRLDRIERFESCLEFLDSFLAEAGQEFIVGMFSQGETEELDMRSSSPISHLSSPNSFDVRSPRDLPRASLFPVFLGSDDARAKSPGIDVNSSPAKGHGVVGIEIVPDVSANNNNVNDLFWEQCLTEAPGSSDTNGEESEKNEAQRRDWWGLNNNVDNLTAQIGHLTPAM